MNVAALETQLRTASDPRIRRSLETAIARVKATTDTPKPVKPQKRTPKPPTKRTTKKPKQGGKSGPRQMLGAGRHTFVMGLRGSIEKGRFTAEDGTIFPVSTKGKTGLINRGADPNSVFVFYPEVKDGVISKLKLISVKPNERPFLVCRGVFSPSQKILCIQGNLRFHQKFRVWFHTFDELPKGVQEGQFCEVKLRRDGLRLTVESVKSLKVKRR